MKPSAICVLSGHRSSSRRWLAHALALLLVPLSPWGAMGPASLYAQASAGGSGWSRALPTDLLAVVNTRASRIASWGRVGEPESSTWALEALDPSSLEHARQKGNLGFVETSRGVVLLLAADEGRRLQLLAIDADSGETLWTKQALDPTEGESVTAAGDVVFLLLRPALQKSAPRRYVLAALDLRDGRELWRTPELFDAPTLVHSIPSKSLLLLHRNDPETPALWAVDLDTGELKWEAQGQKGEFAVSVDRERAMTLQKEGKNEPDLPRSVTSAFANMTDGDDLFLAIRASGFGQGRTTKDFGLVMCRVLRKYDLNTGLLKWEYRHGSGWRDLIMSWWVTDEVVFVKTGRTIAALDRSSGKPLYEVDYHPGLLDPGFYAQIVFHGDAAYYFDAQRQRSSKGRLLAFNTATGRQLWELEIGDHALSSLVPVGDRLLLADKGSLIGLDSGTGKEVLRKKLPFAPQMLAQIDERHALAMSSTRVASFDLGSGQQGYDTGEIPPPTKGPGLADALVIAAIHDLATAQGRWLEADLFVARAWPGYTPEPRSAVSPRSTYFATPVSGQLKVLAVDIDTGKRIEVGPYNEDVLGTVIDEYHGMTYEVRKRLVIAHRFPVID